MQVIIWNQIVYNHMDRFICVRPIKTPIIIETK